MAVRLSALSAGRFLPPGRFLVLISGRGWVDPRAIVRLEGLGKLKKSTSSGTQTGDLPACSIVPQPTTLPRAPGTCNITEFLSFAHHLIFRIEQNDLETKSVSLTEIISFWRIQLSWCFLTLSVKDGNRSSFRISVSCSENYTIEKVLKPNNTVRIVQNLY
jgi:hypothetical protein